MHPFQSDAMAGIRAEALRAEAGAWRSAAQAGDATGSRAGGRVGMPSLGGLIQRTLGVAAAVLQRR
jgi:hypothetical protein